MRPDEAHAGNKVETVNAPKAQTKTPGVTKNFEKKQPLRNLPAAKKRRKKNKISAIKNLNL